MTTVGYGDIYPKTIMGRLNGIIIAFAGVFILSLFVVALTKMLEFDPGEDKAFKLGKRLKKKDQLKIEAANVLSSTWNQKNVLKNAPSDKEAMLSAFRNVRKYMLRFKKVARQIVSFNQTSSEMDIMSNKIEEISKLILQMQESQKNLRKLSRMIRGKKPDAIEGDEVDDSYCEIKSEEEEVNPLVQKTLDSMVSI